MSPSRMVGRAVERDLLEAAAVNGVRGEPCAVVLHGEQGAGKTRLVTDVVESLAGTHEVLWARCLRFSSDATALLPVAQALSRWSRTVSEATCAAAFADADDLSAILPNLGPSRPVEGGRLTSLLAAVLLRIGELRPVVFVADDLQWADSSSLDLLAYLIAGFGPNQHLTIMATYRDTELAAGHRLNQWIADMGRMPWVTVRAVGRLDRVETADLVRALHQGSTARELCPDPDDIYERSLGNPYLSELLVADPASGSTIQEALLASWHRLDPTACVLTQILALGGRPVPVEVLTALAKRSGVSHRGALAALESATAAGLADAHSGGVWFRHPLVAEVIAGTVPPTAASRWHADYVRVLAKSTGLAEHARAALLALHHDAAGHWDEAFSWSIAAADAAATVHATAEESENLQRAVQLWDQVVDDVRAVVGDRVALLERASLAAFRAGQSDAAHVLAVEATRAVDTGAEPLRAVRLLMSPPMVIDAATSWGSWHQLAESAYELAAPHGPSAELAWALRQLSYRGRWAGLAEAEDRSLEAIAVAKAVGSPLMLAHAHLVHSQFHWTAPEGASEALAAWEILRRQGGVLDWGLTSIEVMNCLEGLGHYDALIAQGLRTLHDLTAFGAPALGGPQGAVSAHFLFRLGRWPEAREVLQMAITYRQSSKWAGECRGTAARLARQEGNVDAGLNHLARARELRPDMDPLGSNLGSAQVECLWASGDLDEARECAIADVARVVAVDEDQADELYLWGARSIADIAEASHQESRTYALRGDLDRLDAARATGPPTPGNRDSRDRVHPAMAALIAAERARCLRDEVQVDLWRAARDASAEASLVWEYGWAGYQLGRALLAERGHRPEAADSLRTAYAAMVRLGAKPLAERIRVLATQVHIKVGEPATPQGNRLHPSAWELEGLTRREREILGHILAGRTYAEIARNLFISQKTVSVHVSNLLRKTGTGSRTELAELITRNQTTATVPADPVS